MNFINEYSCYCLLGPQAKSSRFEGNLFVWEVQKKKHFCVWNSEIDAEDISFLKTWQSNFHYISEINLKILKENFTIERVKNHSSITGIDSLDYSGKQNRNFRNYLNRYDGYEVLDNYKDISHVKEMINTWSETSGDKYFRDFSGKNYYFLSNNFHEKCDSVFVYTGDKLLSFGVASPVSNEYCSYIIGKALCLEYPGLSDFTDLKLFEKLFLKYGKFSINLGQAKGGLEQYKKKFNNTVFETHYDGKII